jgi:hypothetical protein
MWRRRRHAAQPVPEDRTNYDGPQGMMGIKRPRFAELVCVPACVLFRCPTASTSTTPLS